MIDLREVRRLERDAKNALQRASQARYAAERAEGARKLEARSAWLHGQMKAAAPEPGSVPELIVVRQTYGLAPAVIKWDVVVEGGAEGRNQYGLLSRRAADDYARALRSRGCAVRVLQSAV